MISFLKKELASIWQTRHFQPSLLIFLGLLLTGLWLLHVLQEHWWACFIWSIFIAASFIFKFLKSLRVSGLALALYAFFFSLLGYGPPFIRMWPLNLFLVSIPIYLILRFSGLVSFKSHWNLRFSRYEWMSLILVVLSSLLCLVTYFQIFPEVLSRFPYIPVPISWWPVIILGAALLNSFREEFLYRYVFQNAFMKELGAFWALLFQALIFGFLHFSDAFPSGWSGVVLTFFFGAALGIQYQFRRSFTLCWLTHAMTDAVMFLLILSIRP